MEELTALITATVSHLGYELIEFEHCRNGVLRVFIDFADNANSPVSHAHPAVSKIGLEDCEKVSTQIHYILDAENIDYQRLEVSSPGLDRPLKKLADFARFSGSKAVVVLKKPLNGRKQYQGILRSPCGETIALELAEKAGPAVLDFTLADIDRAHLVPHIDFGRNNES